MFRISEQKLIKIGNFRNSRKFSPIIQ